MASRLLIPTGRLSISVGFRKILIGSFSKINVPQRQTKKLLQWRRTRALNQQIRISTKANLVPDKFIANGCNSAIFSVNNLSYNSTLVIKQPFLLDENQEISLNEINVLRKLDIHPNIIQMIRDELYEIPKDPNYLNKCPDVLHYGIIPSLVLEKMDFNLEELLKNTKLSTIDRCDIIVQICEAETHMRFLGIVHRDLKLSNVLVKKTADNNGSLINSRVYQVKVADFDDALDMSVSSKMRQVEHSGAPAITAPEILNVLKDKNNVPVGTYARSDIWAIGVMVYEIFDRENPFQKLNPTNYSVDDLPEIENAPTVINKLVKKMLEIRPELRFSTCVCADVLNIAVLREIYDKFNGIIEMGCKTAIKEFIFLALYFCRQMHFSAERLMNIDRLKYVLDYTETDSS